MEIHSLRAVLHALNRAQVRYLIVGGIAVNIHGYQRMTHDLDLVVQLNQENALRAIETVSELGYRPIIPVASENFADEQIRTEWIETKNMKVFSLVSDKHPATTLDIFVSEPFDFDLEYQQATTVMLDHDLNVKIVSIGALIKMKEQANRDRDKDDIQHLNWILEELRKHDRR